MKQTFFTKNKNLHENIMQVKSAIGERDKLFNLKKFNFLWMKTLLLLIALLAFTGNLLYSQQLTITLTTTNVICHGVCNGSITASVSGGTVPYTYLWNDSLSSNTATITNLCAGGYHLTVTDALGITSLASASISQPTAILATLIPHNPTSPNSNDGYIETTVSGGTPPYTYLWIPGQTTTLNIYNLTSGTYTLYILDVNGCSSSYTVQLVDLSSSCQALFSYYADTTYNGFSHCYFTDLSVPDSTSTITSYFWDFGDGSSSALANPIHPFSAGTHLVCLTITTSSGCTSFACQYVYVNGNQTTCQAYFYSYPDTINVPPHQYNFVDQSVPDSASTIVSWNWTFSGGVPATSTIQNPSGIVFQAPGTYNICLTIATSNGCSSSYCETITVGNTGCQLYANITTQSPTTIGGSDGYIESNVCGGTPPYAYSWNTGATTANIYNLTSGVYTLSVVDANGCQNIFYAELYEPYDTTGGIIVDTLWTGILDSCLNFVPDSFYIASITTDPNSYTVSIVWVFVGGGQTATFTVTYTFSQYGNTLVIITLNCGTKTLTTYQSYINIVNTLLVPIYGAEQSAFVYPVPFSNKLNVDFTSQKSDNINISLIDITGKLMISKKLHALSGVNSTDVNTSQLPSGIYILNIETTDGIIRKQVVK